MKHNAKKEERSPSTRGRRIGNTGWVEGTVQDFLGLTDEEAAIVKTKAALAVFLQRRRKSKGWSQVELAERMGSGQSRIAKIEAAEHSVTLDLMVKALLCVGATIDEIGAVIAELGRQPRMANRFFEKYQDRVVFGKDSYRPSEYHTYFRVLETDDEYFPYYKRYHAFWRMYGLDLPEPILRKLYYENALRIIPGLDTSLYEEWK